MIQKIRSAVAAPFIAIAELYDYWFARCDCEGCAWRRGEDRKRKGGAAPS